jgi:large subunit ribosomal protein L18
LNRNTAKQRGRKARKLRVRRKINGTAQRPRLTVYRSLKHVYAQIIDDEAGKTLVSASTMDKELAGDIKKKNTVDAAKSIGTALATKAVAYGIKQVVFDRNGYVFHGKVKALADAAREAGLEF